MPAGRATSVLSTQAFGRIFVDRKHVSRLFCAVLQEAMGVWRVTVSGDHGFVFGDGLPQLLDLNKVADDVLLFARSAAEAAILVCWVAP